MRATEFVREYVNKKMLDPSWHAETTVNTKLGPVELDAVYHGAVTDQIIITARQNKKYLGQVRFVISTVDRPEPVLVAGNLSVDPEYRRQGIASVMYQWAKELGNSIEPSHTQTDAGRAFWQSIGTNEAIEDQRRDLSNRPKRMDVSSIPWYHGTHQEFSQDVVPGMWATQNQEDAEYYARELGGGEGVLLTIHLKPHNSLYIKGDLNSVTDRGYPLPSGTQSVHNDSDIRILDPKIIKSMSWSDVPEELELVAHKK